MQDILSTIDAAESMIEQYLKAIGVPFREQLLAQAVVNLQEAQRKLRVLIGD